MEVRSRLLPIVFNWFVCFTVISFLHPHPLCARKAGKKGAGVEKGGSKKQAARLYFKKGVEQYKAGDYSKALNSFLASYELYPHPKTLINIAQCYEKMNNYSRAIEYFEKYVNQPAGKVEESEKREIEDRIEEIMTKVGVVELKGKVDGELIIDGEPFSKTPVKGKFYLPVGLHNIMVKSGGKIIFNKDIKIQGGSVISVNIEHEKTHPIKKGKSRDMASGKGGKKEVGVSSPEEVRVKVSLKTPTGEKKKIEGKKAGEGRGILHIFSSVDSSDVIINGQKIGITPWEESLREGFYKVRIESAGYPSWSKLVEVKSGKTIFIDVDLDAVKKKPAPYWIAAAGASALCAGLWAGFGIAGIKAKKEALDMDPNKNDRCKPGEDPACVDEYNSLVDKSKRRFLVADITGPLALVFAGGAVAMFFLLRTEKREADAKIKVSFIAPLTSSRTGGLGFGGVF